MKMMQDGVEVTILPDEACCTLSEYYESPFDLSECPKGCDVCTGDCFYYSAEKIDAGMRTNGNGEVTQNELD